MAKSVPTPFAADSGFSTSGYAQRASEGLGRGRYLASPAAAAKTNHYSPILGFSSYAKEEPGWIDPFFTVNIRALLQQNKVSIVSRSLFFAGLKPPAQSAEVLRTGDVSRIYPTSMF